MIKILTGDSLEMLKTLPSESIDCVVTSPPYYALRDYGVEGQIGMEATHWDYLVHLVHIFDEVRRVLKPTGTCFVNLGDTYGGGGKGAMGKNSWKNGDTGTYPKVKATHNKSLLQIPARFAIHMTDRDWILRNKIIWHKPNALPQSVRDRFTVDYEEVLFFTKSKKYYFDQQFEPLAASTLPRYGRGVSREAKHGSQSVSGAGALSQPRANIKHLDKSMGTGGGGFVGHSGYFKADGSPLFNAKGRNKRSVWAISTKSYAGAHFAVFPEELVRTPILAGCPPGGTVLDPFMGSGTTLAVAAQEGREGIGIEINPGYVALAKERLANVQVRIPQETQKPPLLSKMAASSN